MRHEVAHCARAASFDARARMPAIRFTVVYIVCLFAAWPVAARAAEPIGTWLTGDGQARIRIARCGSGMCGTIVWLREPIDPATGRAQVDDKNRDPARHQRPIIGLKILNMRASSDGTWSGSI